MDEEQYKEEDGDANKDVLDHESSIEQPESLRFRRINLKGEPLSETILRDRGER